jgi:hypothetical protein
MCFGTLDEHIYFVSCVIELKNGNLIGGSGDN